MAFTLDSSPLDSPFATLDTAALAIVGGNGILIEIKALRLSDNAETWFRFGTDGYNDPTAPGYYDPRLLQPLMFRRDLFSQGSTGGPNRISYGEIRIANDDGELDDIRQYALLEVTMLIGDLSQPYYTMVPLIKGRVTQALFNFRDLTIQIRDRLQDFAQPLQTNKYLGNNVLPDGLEGVEEDIKDKPKPLLFGMVLNVSPVMVNTSKLIYQVNDGLTEGITAVYDNGMPLGKALDYVSQEDMMATEPDPGYFRVWPAGGYFRLGAVAVGNITCDAADRSAANLNTAAQVAVRIAKRPPESGQLGISDADIVWADVTALDVANDAVVGIWMPDESQYGNLLTQILGSVGAWYGFDRMGMFRMQRLELPEGVGVITFRKFDVGSSAGIGDYDIIDLRFMPTSDLDSGVPSYEVSLEYAHNLTVQNGSNVAGGVTQDRKNFLREATRKAVATDDAVKTPYPYALQKEVDTLLIDALDASDEANRLLTMYKRQRDYIELDTPMTADLINLVDIGAVVNVAMDRFDYDAGKTMRVIGMQYDGLRRIMTFAVWGGV